MACATPTDGGCVIIGSSIGWKVFIDYDGTRVDPLAAPWTCDMTIYDRVDGTELIASSPVSIDTNNKYFAANLDTAQIQGIGSGVFIAELDIENPSINPNRSINFIKRIQFKVQD